MIQLKNTYKSILEYISRFSLNNWLVNENFKFYVHDLKSGQTKPLLNFSGHDEKRNFSQFLIDANH